MNLGPEIGPGGGAGARWWREGGRPAVVKLRDDFGLAAELARDHPEILVIGRVHEGPELDPVNDYNAGKSPEQAAEDFISRQRAKYELNPAIKVWEGPNETGLGHGAATAPDVVSRMVWYASFEIWRLVLLKTMGLRGVVGNFSTGTPDLALWAHFRPALASAVAHGGYLGVHEYGGAFLWHDAGSNILRYRNVPEIAQSGVKLIITECGLDRVQGPPGYVTGAWRDLCPQWEQRGDVLPGGDCASFYAAQLRWYEAELRRDGAMGCVFTCDPAWPQYRIDNSAVLDELIQYGRTQPEPQPPQPPEPEPEPEPEEPMTLLNDIVIVTLKRKLTRRDAKGNSLETLEPGESRKVYVRPINFRWQFGDRRLIIVDSNVESLWAGTEAEPSVEYL